MARAPIVNRGTMTARVGNYAAPVDTSGMDPEMVNTMQTGQIGTQYVNPMAKLSGLGRSVANSFRGMMRSHTHPSPDPGAAMDSTIAARQATIKGYRILKGQR